MDRRGPRAGPGADGRLRGSDEIVADGRAERRHCVRGCTSVLQSCRCGTSRASGGWDSRSARCSAFISCIPACCWARRRKKLQKSGSCPAEAGPTGLQAPVRSIALGNYYRNPVLVRAFLRAITTGLLLESSSMMRTLRLLALLLVVARRRVCNRRRRQRPCAGRRRVLFRAR